MTTMPSNIAQCGTCGGCTVHHRAICRAADVNAIADLNRISHTRQFAQGQVIQAQGEPSEIVGNVIDGVVKLSMASVDGDERIVGLQFPSDFFGRVFAEESRFCYEAATDVTLCCMNRSAFERFLADHPLVEHELLITKLDELDATREWVSLVSGHTTMQRVASFLYILAKRSRNRLCDRDGNSVPVISVPISRRDIADFLGTTPETLSRNIQAMSRREVIRIIDAKHFALLDEAALVRLAGESEEDLAKLAAIGN